MVVDIVSCFFLGAGGGWGSIATSASFAGFSFLPRDPLPPVFLAPFGDTGFALPLDTGADLGRGAFPPRGDTGFTLATGMGAGVGEVLTTSPPSAIVADVPSLYCT